MDYYNKLLPAVCLAVLLGLAAASARTPGSAVIRQGIHPASTVQSMAASESRRDLIDIDFVVDSLKSPLPEDVEGGLRQANHRIVQRAANRFSWQEFIAINSSAKLRGDMAEISADGGALMWETWKDASEVYRPDGSDPGAWDTKQDSSSKIQTKSARYSKVITIHNLCSTLQAVQADGTLPATLTDQHGHLVRYEVRMNRSLFDYVREKGLYNGERQAKQDSISFPNGSILIKAAWRELQRGEESRFLTAESLVYDLKDGKPVHSRRRRMGLVGFHIATKTASAPQWIWSTFEHIDNVSGPHASFHSPSCLENTANRQQPAGIPNQVTRLTPIPGDEAEKTNPDADNLRELNRTMQSALSQQKSVLQYYELVNTQWPLPPPQSEKPAVNTVFHTLPTTLANTTMETFTQDTSSCIGCHSMARTSRADSFVSADFTFTLNRARPEIKSSRTLPAPKQPVTEWDKKNWRSIKRGIELTQRTYELMPGNVTAKLHCGSCHMDSGANPASGWWAGMITKFEYPATPKLYARINQCFERSMNGKPLAVTSKEMLAFINYMQWLDEQYNASHSSPPKVGLPPVEKLIGNIPRGEEIYAQKCASCHGKEGQGLYESGVYYRPALWGPNSFNKLAGLARQEKLAPFLHSNMPYGSGGELTVQETWDLTEFIDAKKRPEKQ